MDKIVPPVELKNEENKKSAQYILSIGPQEPAEYTNASKFRLYLNLKSKFRFIGILRSRTGTLGRSWC